MRVLLCVLASVKCGLPQVLRARTHEHTSREPRKMLTTKPTNLTLPRHSQGHTPFTTHAENTLKDPHRVQHTRSVALTCMIMPDVMMGEMPSSMSVPRFDAMMTRIQ